MRAIVLTSTFPRHQFVANYAAERLEVAGVWQEEKSFRPTRYAGDEADREVIERHFAARNASEASYFGGHDRLRLTDGTLHRRLAPGTINEADEAARMRALEPDVVLVFGTGILRQPILEPFEGRILNIHLGLSPYYRGSGTNFWPLVNREPEYVGATIHFIDAGIDTGPIVAHARPEIEAGDGPHDIGNKAIIAAAEVLVEAAAGHGGEGLRAVPQQGGGRLYQRKDFDADAVRRLYRNFETGMIPEYLAQRVARDARLDLLSLGPAE